MNGLRPARLRGRDLVRVAGNGLVTRPLRCVLSALGIAIGVASMLGVVGISSSSQAELARTLDALGTDLLTVSPGQTMTGDEAQLPTTAEPMIGRISQVRQTAAIGSVTDSYVYRNDRVPEAETNGIATYAARISLFDLAKLELADGSWLNRTTSRFPVVVLGHDAARRLGVVRARPGVQILIGGEPFTVVGILEPATLAPELDSAALVGWPVSQRTLGFDGHPTTVYVSTDDTSVGDVRAVLGATANPAAPSEVDVSRPSDALAAKLAAGRAFTGLLLGIGAVALLVGGVGIANTMVISVLERRAEIGLRRALGATRGQIRTQFLAESVLLAALGAFTGLVLGVAVTAGYAVNRGWPPVVPAWAVLGALGATLAVGAVSGLYPAMRAARLAPTEALATT